MVANLKSLVIPIAPAPVVDTGWLDNLVKAGGSALDQASENKSFNRLADQIGGAPVQQQQPGFLGRLFGAQAPQAAAIPAPGASSQIAATNPAPVQGNVSPGKPNDVYNGFITTVQQGGLTNPYGLAAVAATGRAESSFDPSKVNAAWNDPSASGQAGTAGGIMSWRNERLANLRNYAQAQGEDPSNISPQTQAKFFMQEDPSLVQKLNNAQSPQEAANLMAKAWAFKGYDQPGGEAARRQALTQNYYATQFANQQPQTAQANTPMEQGDGQGPTQVASLDPRAGMPQPSAPAFNPATASPTAMMQQLGLNSPDPGQPAYHDPIVAAVGPQQPAPVAPQQQAQQVPQQVAQNAPAPVDNGPRTLAPGVTPIARGGVSPQLIQSMLRDPNLRQAGLQLWQQNATGKTGDAWDFVTLPDGTLARANKQSGEVQSLGQFAKPQEGVTNVNGTLVKNSDGSVVYKGGPDTTVLTADEKKALGLPAAVPFQRDSSGKVSQIGNPGTSVKIDNGTIPAGYQAVRDADGNLLRYEPVPGGPADSSKTDKATSENKQTLTDVVTTAAERARKAVSSAIVPTSGVTGRVAADYLPGSNSAEVRRQVAVLKSNATIEALNAMRQQSKTGGALGNVTESEGAMLAAKAGALDPESPNFARDLSDYEQTLLRTVHGYEAGTKIFNDTRNSGDADTVVPAPAAKPSGKTSSGVQWSVGE